MTEIAFPLFIILLMVAANALYVAAEFAVVGSRRSRVQDVAESGNAAAARLLAILKDPERLDHFVAGCQIGITVSSLIAGAFGQSALTPVLAPYLGAVGGQVAAVVIVLVLLTCFQVVLGELLPKTVALRYPEKLAMATLWPMRISLVLFRPLIAIFNGTAFALMRALKLDVEHSHSHVHSPEELEGLYRESAAGGLIDATERDMLSGALNVNERRVREIMTPRPRLTSADGAASVGEELERLAATAHSRFPVIGETPDTVVGIVHLRELFAAAERDPTQLVSAVMRPPLVVADVTAVPDLWKALRAARRHSAIVVNEYGSVAGMVTLEDAFGEIFGEMRDEFDDELEPIRELDGRVLVRGDVRIETLNDRFDLRLPNDDADTVGGLIWHELCRLPLVGDQVEVGPDSLHLTVESMDRRAVREVSFAVSGGDA